MGWLSGTVRPDRPEDIPRLPFDLARVLSSMVPGGSQMGSPFRWYQKSLRSADNGWSVGYEGVGDARGTASVTLRQSVTESYPELVLALLRLGLRPSRLDLAADVHNDLARPRAYFDRRHSARTRTAVAGWVYREDGSGLSSLTIGSRASERHARIYDKPVTPEQWRVRHELELKGELAASIGAALLGGADALTLWSEQYGRLVQWV